MLQIIEQLVGISIAFYPGRARACVGRSGFSRSSTRSSSLRKSGTGHVDHALPDSSARLAFENVFTEQQVDQDDASGKRSSACRDLEIGLFGAHVIALPATNFAFVVDRNPRALADARNRSVSHPLGS